ncbi:MAG TPA: tetratricopeptide repeat protein [bacterium]|nr:tetratricopeptide repeat protein [bacterium]
MVRLSPKEEIKLRQYEELLAREPNALVFAPLASFYAREYDFTKAVNVLRRGLAIYPNYFSACVLLARCHIALDDFPAAVDELEKVLAADPYNISALGLLSDELRNRGRLAEARDHYLKILEIEPENEEYAYKLELLGTLIEGGPFAREPESAEVVAEAVTPPTPEPVSAAEAPPPDPESAAEAPPPPEPAPAPAPEPAEVEAFALEEITVAADEPTEESAAVAEELATLTLAKIYEDQGLFVHAREVIEKVLAREPDNAAARDALEHVDAAIAGEDSPTGASVITLIQKVEAVSGLLERDELELWEEVSAGVEDALAGFEEITLAQAIAAVAGLKSFDRFLLQGDKRAFWEMDVAAVAPTAGADGADEMDFELPLFTALDLPTGVNVADLSAEASPGIAGTDEFDVELTAGFVGGVDSFEVAGSVAAEAGAAGAEDLVLDLKAEITSAKSARPPAAGAPPAEAEERKGGDEFAVKPERYRPRKPLELKPEPFEREEDFLGWLDSIRLKEL